MTVFNECAVAIKVLLGVIIAVKQQTTARKATHQLAVNWLQEFTV